MHELSIASNLINLVEQELQKQVTDSGSEDLPHVRALHLKIGALSCVHRDSLLYSFELASQGTQLEGATLEIETVPVEVYCQCCDQLVQLEGIQSFRCPRCDTPSGDIRAGRELDLVAIELDERCEV